MNDDIYVINENGYIFQSKPEELIWTQIGGLARDIQVDGFNIWAITKDYNMDL